MRILKIDIEKIYGDIHPFMDKPPVWSRPYPEKEITERDLLDNLSGLLREQDRIERAISVTRDMLNRVWPIVEQEQADAKEDR